MRWFGWLLLGLVFMLPVIPASAQAEQSTIALAQGEQPAIECEGALEHSTTAGGPPAACEDGVAPHATAVPVPVHGHMELGICREPMEVWHPAVIGGCTTGHEHGDAPPRWLLDAGYFPLFNHAANTPNENALVHKHSGFKGFSAHFHGVDIYVVMHLDTNPGGHVSRFHSYQVWARDSAGGVSHWHGWLDFAQDNQTGPNLRRIGCESTEVRPIIAVNDEDCGVVQFESWYSRAGAERAWSWDFGFNVRSNYYTGGDPADPNTWAPTGGLNTVRRIEAAWYAERSNLRGTFWATQFGNIVTGPNDALCGTERAYGERTYTLLCLEQYVAPTMTTVGFPGNSIQLTYDEAGVTLPN